MSGHPSLDQAHDLRALVEHGALRALTLVERRARLAQGSSDGFAPRPTSDRGQRVLHAWRTQPPFDRTNLFAKRLALDGLDGLDEAMILRLMDPEANASTSAPDAPWIGRWQSAFEAGSTPNTSMQLRDIVGNDYALFQPLEPLFALFIERAHAELETITISGEHCRFDRHRIVSTLAAQLRALILPKIIRTWVLELNVARIAGQLDGDSAQARFRHFLLQLSEPGKMATVLHEYPVLARVLVETLEHWLANSVELIRHLAHDWTALTSAFPALSDAGPLVRIEPGLGDLHRGGKSVTMFAWSSGFRLVYKPRSLAVDQHFQHLLRWANARGFSLQFRTLGIVDRGDHGWSESVEHESTCSRESVEAFYRRLGGQLALLYALEGADFHAENIIAAGSHPLLIDLEGLFHPRFESSAPADDTGAHRFTMHSVLRVGLLPRRMWSRPDAAGLDLSGLGAKSAQRSPVALPAWTDQGTDFMRLAPKRGQIQLSLAHLPQVDNEAVDPTEFRNDVGAGFDEMYRLMLAHQPAFLEFVERTFGDDPVRCIFRSTHRYSKILFDSYHPDALRDAIERERVLDMLWVDVERSPRLEKVLQAERADLSVGDIPLFVTTPSSRDASTSRGHTIPDVFESCALQHVRERIARLDENDLHRQRWMIDASFASMVLSDAGESRSRLPEPLTPIEPTRERLAEHARAIGFRLHRLALEDGGGASWMGIEPRSSQEWQVGPVGIDLYAGLSGIVLFLAYLGSVLDEGRFTSLARRALSSLRRQLAREPQSWRRRGAGAFTGVAGYVYLLSHLSSLWQSSEPLHEAERMVPTLVELIDADTTFDVMGGTAGCIAALLSLHAVAPGSAALAAAVRGGQRLVARAQPLAGGVGWLGPGREHAPLTGFSHGNAGIAWALLRLFEATGQTSFFETALAALDYERGLFSCAHGNWPDLRQCASHEAGFAAQVAWCHGAPGIVLSRIDTLAAIDDSRTRAEIAAGLLTTIACGLGSNHSLCHGVVGNLETLWSAGQRLDDATIRSEAIRLSGLTLASIETQGLVTGVPHGTETPGLMVGIAGIGHGLLRLAFPGEVPSVLLLQPPYGVGHPA